jgi:hypothetical protein
MRCSNKTTTGLSLLGGAGLGAALMYLMDPEQGHERRTHLGEKAGYAKDATAAALAAAMEVAREKGQSASEALAEKLADLGSAGAETAGHLFDRANETGHRIGKTSRRYTDSARESIGSPRSWLGREEQRSYVPSTGSALGAVACLAAGFGLMYLMDPQQGRRRRHVARDKTMKWLREIGDMSRRTGRHWANKSRGYAHETMSAARSVTGGMTGGEGFGRSLAERIRERIGSLGRGKSVNVDCDDCGRVTLGGDCTPDEVAILVAEVQSVPGVDSIDNRMNLGAGAGLGQ